MLDSVEVNKPRELDEIGSTLNQPMEDRYSPSKYKKSLSYEGDETKNPIPKGKCDPGVLADMITVCSISIGQVLTLNCSSESSTKSSTLEH